MICKTMSSTNPESEIEGSLAVIIQKPEIPIAQMVGLTIDSRKDFNSTATAVPQFSITALADELILEIFELLIVESSVCLGLTCTKFYKIHWAIWGKVELLKPLDFWRTQTSEHIDIRLYDLLRDWMGHDMVFDYKRWDPKFVSAAEHAARQAQRRAFSEYAPIVKDDMENVCGDVFKGVDPPFESILEWASSSTAYEQLCMMTGTDIHSMTLMGFARQKAYFGHKQGERRS